MGEELGYVFVPDCLSGWLVDPVCSGCVFGWQYGHCFICGVIVVSGVFRHVLWSM